MDNALQTILAWSDEDKIDQPTIRIFTPNMQTENYDYILHWLANREDRPIPLTQRQGDEEVWYLLMEEDREIPEVRFVPWYEAEVENAVLIRSIHTEALKLEAWATPEFASKSGLINQQKQSTN